MKTTIHDIAERANCSITTVSQVLNGKGQRFSSELQKKIVTLAKDLNYRPNHVAVSLVTKRTRTVGLVLPNVHNMYFALLAEEIEKCCRQLNLDLVLCNSLDDPRMEENYIDTLIGRNVDGIIVPLAINTTMEQCLKNMQKVADDRIAFCLIDRLLPSKELDMVTINHELGGYLATRHLLDLGHRRLAFLTGPEKLLDAQLRLKGACKAISECPSCEVPFIFTGDYSWEKGYEMAEQIVKSKPSAIFAFNDWSAFGLIIKLKEMGLRIPEDLSIVGYDDIPLLNGGVLSLTTIHQPIDQLAEEALNTLLFRFENQDAAAVQRVIDPSIRIRKSTRNLMN